MNSRLAPSVYLASTDLARTGRVAAKRAGEAAEYALVMRRLPERRMLPFLLRTRQVTRMMRSLAEIMAAFHVGAEP